MNKTGLLKKLMNNQKVECIVLFMLCVGVKIVISFHEIPLIYISDCTSSISVAARLAGYDWSDVVRNAGYYGIGYLFVFFPLYLLKISPVIIYRIVALTSAVLVGITPLIARAIIARNFPDIDKMKRFSISLISGCFSICSTITFSMWNEEPLLLSLWIIAFLMFEILNYKTKKNELALFVLLGYILFLHTRAVVTVVGVFIIHLVVSLHRRKRLLSVLFWPAYCAEYSIVKYAVRIYQNLIWADDVKNSSVSGSVSKAVNKLQFSKASIKGILMIDTGIIFTQAYLTCGIIIISIIALLLAAYLLKRISLQPGEKRAIAVGLAFMLCWAAFVFGQSITWLPSIVDKIIAEEYSYDSSFRAFTYTRYSGPYVPIIVMCGMIIFILHPEWRKIILNSWCCCIITITLLFDCLIIDYLKGRKNNFFLIPSVLDAKDIDKQAWVATSVLFLAFIIIMFTIFKYYQSAIVVISLVVLILTNIQRCATFTNITHINSVKNFKTADAGERLLKSMKKVGIPIGDDVYVYDNTEASNHNIFYMYQYLNYDLHIIPYLPDAEKYSSGNGTIVFTNGIPLSDSLLGYWYTKLDDNEYVFCKNEYEIDFLREQGLTLNEYGTVREYENADAENSQ